MLKRQVRTIILMAGLAIVSLAAHAQERVSGGIQFQAYPTGFIPGLSLEIPLSEHSSIDFRGGFNIVRHGDAGVQDDERGWGWGLSHGYKYYLNSNAEKWYIGARVDFWFNTVDWIDMIDTPEEESGTSEITVFQPTAILGYKLPLGEKFILMPEVALGAEINLVTEGADVGEGAILLVGVAGHVRL